MQRLEQRISALETHEAANEDPVQFLYLAALGQDDEGIVESSTQTAQGYKRWDRARGESIADFRERLENDCLKSIASDPQKRRVHLVVNSYSNGALYAFRPKEDYERRGAHATMGSVSTVRIRSVNGSLLSLEAHASEFEEFVKSMTYDRPNTNLEQQHVNT